MDSTNYFNPTYIYDANTASNAQLFAGTKKTEDKTKFGILSPWWIYYRQMKALFSEDSEIEVVFDPDRRNINIFVDNPDKAEALKSFIPSMVTLAGVKFFNNIIPSDKAVTPVEGSVAERAFAGNEAVVDIYLFESEFMTNSMTFITFKNVVVQYYSDNAGSLDGITSDIYENLARAIFVADGHFYSTAKGSNVIKMESDSLAGYKV